MIRLSLQTVIWGAVVALAAWILWLGWLWSPVRQAELHTQNLLDRASRCDWEAVSEMMAPDYRDTWGHGKKQALHDAEEVGSQFFSLRIGPVEALAASEEADLVAVSARLVVYGSGTPIAHAIVEAVHKLQEPFVFRWRKAGSWPWQWTLSGLEQEELVARYPR